MPTTIVSNVWTLVSGPGSATLVTPNNLDCGVSGITVAGDYVFRLTVTDNLSQVNHADCTLHVSGPFTVIINNSISTAGISSVTGPTLTYVSGNNIPFTGSGTFNGTTSGYTGTLIVNTSGTIPALPIGVFHARLKINGSPFGTAYPATSGGSYSWSISISATDTLEFDLST